MGYLHVHCFISRYLRSYADLFKIFVFLLFLSGMSYKNPLSQLGFFMMLESAISLLIFSLLVQSSTDWDLITKSPVIIVDLSFASFHFTLVRFTSFWSSAVCYPGFLMNWTFNHYVTSLAMFLVVESIV